MVKKILVIEDEDDILSLIESGLKALGYVVVTAKDGLSGLELARSQKPDLIILDVMLPKMDGYNVCRMLKYDKQYNSLPILMLTARGQQADKDIIKEIKADAYILKPFDWDHLVKEINRLLT